jgi:hypothetical protein
MSGPTLSSVTSTISTATTGAPLSGLGESRFMAAVMSDWLAVLEQPGRRVIVSHLVTHSSLVIDRTVRPAIPPGDGVMLRTQPPGAALRAHSPADWLIGSSP